MPVTQMTGNSFFLSSKTVLSQKRIQKMKHIGLFLIIITALFGCKNASKQITISGEIKGLGTDTLLLYGLDELYDRIDTVYVEDDKFSFQTDIDTATYVALLFNDRTEYPIFLDKGNHIKIEGDTSNLNRLHVEGNIYNEEFTAFQHELEQAGLSSSKAIEEKAEAFIKEHHSSFVSLYLLDKYFVQKDEPNFEKIKSLIDVMTGVLQDKTYIEKLNEQIAQAEKTDVGKYAPFFNLPNVKGEKISRSSEVFKKKNLLINFWASWGDSIANKQTNRELRKIYDSYKKSKYFAMLGVSFDINKQQWKDAIKKDTLNWEQVCDFGGLNSEATKPYSGEQLPANILLAPDGKILAKNLQGAALKKKIEEVVAEATEKDKNDKKK